MAHFQAVVPLLALALFSPCLLAAQPAHAFIVGLGSSIDDPPTVIPLTKWVGAKSLRVDAPWAQIERAPNQYALPGWLDRQIALMNQSGIEPMLILAYGNPIYQIKKPLDDDARNHFANYCEWLVRNLKSKVKFFQLWNEWEARTGGGDPGTAEEYVLLARLVVPRLRVANPDAVLISTGVSYPGLTGSWANDFVRLKGHQLFDAIAAHPYVWHLKKNRRPESAIDLLDKFSEKALSLDGKRMPLYVTEFGYPDFDHDLGTTPAVASQLLRRFYLLASSRPWVVGVWWYCARDQGIDRANREHGFGIYDRELRAKNTARMMREISSIVASKQRGSIASVNGNLVFQSFDREFTFEWKPVEPRSERQATVGQWMSWPSR